MTRLDSNAPVIETNSAPATGPNRYNTMTENRTDDQTSNTTDRTTYADRFSQRMKEMDHSSPVDGPNRAFERNNEGRPAKTDGGRPSADERRTTEEAARAPDEEDTETRAPDEEEDENENRRFRQKMKEMDHSSPVEGPNRTFARGNEDQSVPR